MGYCRFAAILPLLWCAGCCWMLPPGDPPENEIVDIHPPAERDRRGAENDAVTSLAGYTLQNCPRRDIDSAPAALAPVAGGSSPGAGEISGIRYDAKAALVLRVSESAAAGASSSMIRPANRSSGRKFSSLSRDRRPGFGISPVRTPGSRRSAPSGVP